MTLSNSTSPRTAGERDGVRRLDDFDRLVEDLGDTRRSDTRAVARLAYSAHQRLQRRQEAHLVGHERDERADA